MDTPRGNDLFMNSLADMVDDTSDLYEVDPMTAPEDVWRELKEERPHEFSGTKVSTARYLANLFHGKRDVRLFSRRCWMYSHVTLELDMLSSGKYKQSRDPPARVHVPAAEADGADAPTNRRDGIEKKVRDISQNSLVLARHFYSSRENKTLLRGIVRVASPVMSFHTRQQKANRCVRDSDTWLNGMQRGGFTEYIADVLSSLSTAAGCKWIGFALPPLDNVAFACTDEMLVIEDVLAKRISGFMLAVAGEHLRRNLWMLVSWPALARQFLVQEGEYEEFVNKFLQARGDNLDFCRRADDVPGVAEIQRRSIFHKACVSQISALVDSLPDDRIMTDRARRWLERKFLRCIVSQAEEDAFNRMKNYKQKGYGSKFSRPTKTFGIALEKRIPSVVHKYDEVLPSCNPVVPGAVEEMTALFTSMVREGQCFKKLNSPMARPLPLDTHRAANLLGHSIPISRYGGRS